MGGGPFCRGEDHHCLLPSADHLDIRGRIVDFPIGWNGKLEMEFRMVKNMFLDISLTGIIPKDKTIDAPEVFIPVEYQIPSPQPILPFLRPAPDYFDTVFWIRMGGKPAWQSASIRAWVHPLQGFKEAAHLTGIVAHPACIFDA